MACGFNPEGGTRNFRFATRETHSELGEYLTPIRKGDPRDGFFLRAESFYNVASSIDEMDEGGILGPRVIDSYGGVSLHRQSWGEFPGPGEKSLRRGGALPSGRAGGGAVPLPAFDASL